MEFCFLQSETSFLQNTFYKIHFGKLDKVRTN